MEEYQIKDLALGCIVGALVGDAAGAPLEFKRQVEECDIDAAIRMSGGGVIDTEKGQVTDDGEMTIALAMALCQENPRYRFPLNNVASSYVDWHKSRPIDCGMTCARALSVLTDDKRMHAECMLANAARCNMASEANGALMRATPIPIWCHRFDSINVVAQYARLDAMLTHPSQTCVDCNAIYCVALWSLIRNGGDAHRARMAMDDYVTNHIFSPAVKRWLDKDVAGGTYAERHSDVARRNIGHVKHAFCMAIDALHNPPVDFESGIRRVLEMGGDTDTNAAIVGGMLGAMFGYDDIPSFMKDPVMKYSRTALYSPASAKYFVDSVYFD